MSNRAMAFISIPEYAVRAIGELNRDMIAEGMFYSFNLNCISLMPVRNNKIKIKLIYSSLNLRQGSTVSDSNGVTVSPCQ